MDPGRSAWRAVRDGRRTIALLAGVMGLVGCSRIEVPEQPSVVVITLDTTRADHLSTLGGPPGITPNLDAFGDRSAVFTNARSETNVTNPSHLSVMTGMRAIEHGVMNNKTRMPPEVRTLPQALRQRGYDTAAFLSVHHLAALGWTGFRAMPRVAKRLDSPEVTDRALAWLAQRDGAPFFLWVHYFDPHTPYEPDPAVAERFYAADPEVQARAARHAGASFLGQHRWLTEDEWRGDSSDPSWGRALYAAEVHQTDREIGRLLRGLSEVAPEAVIVVTADHGESLDEHGIYFTHAGLYDVSLRIPLIIHIPGLAPLRSSVPVGSLDVAPTLAELTGITLDRAAGRSLVPLLLGGTTGFADREVFVHQGAHNDAVAIHQGPWKLIWKIRQGHRYVSDDHELFHLERDPAERHNQIGEHAEIVDALRPFAEPWVELGLVKTNEATQLDAAAMEQLRALGYVDP
jgi:arylsulfatase A-like enzyme